MLFPNVGHATPEISANNAVLIEQSSGRVLYDRQANEKQSIASITKIMTAIVAIASGKMDEKTTISSNAVHTEGSSIYLKEGDKVKIEDLVYGLMLRSGNDAAVAIAEHIGGSVEGFVFLMNQKASWLGMTNTQFDNPHGLDSDNHYSTAYDMGMLMRYAMENDYFKKVTGTSSFQSENTSYPWKNKNKLLTSLYEHTTGGKTGYTKHTGRTLVSTAEKDGMELIAVTLDAPNDWEDHISLFEWGFENYDMENLSQSGQVQYQLNDELVNGYVYQNVFYPLSEKEKQEMNGRTYLLSDANATEENKIGKTVFYLNEHPIVETSIFNYPYQPQSVFQQVWFIVKEIIGL